MHHQVRVAPDGRGEVAITLRRQPKMGDVLLGIYGTIIGFWFGERSALKVPNLKDIIPGFPGEVVLDSKENNENPAPPGL